MRRIPFPLIALLAAATMTCAPIAHAQDPLTAFPNNYKLALDNPQVRVIRAHYGPHEKVGVHDHSNYPTVYVYLSDSGEVRFTHVEEKAFVMTRPPTKAGAFRVAPGRPERHSVENLGDLPSDYLRIELKQIPLSSLQKPTRGEAPADLSKSQVEPVFHDPQLDIERIVCLTDSPCTVPASKSPSLLVAFTAATLTGSAQKQLKPSDVLWIPASGQLTVSAASNAPAHLLRLELHESGPHSPAK